MMSADQRNYFRQDIQGLRGLAVLLVVIYHSGIGLSGGFVGVDMFFVISGFVISKLLLRELEQTGTISLKNFYTRRARRIMPASALVTVAILGISVFVLSPFGDQQNSANAAKASTLFLANAYMFLENSYFSLVENPFRHMWSLAVEEQFYFVFPGSLLLVWKLTAKSSEIRRQKILGVGVVSVTILSFVFGAMLSFGYRLTPLPERFAFFGTPSRIWEFGVGVLLAIFPIKTNLFKRVSVGLFVLSTCAIVWSVTQLKSFTLFPGYVAFVPVIGTAGLIIVGHNSDKLSQIMSIRFLTRLGDWSYGWYLWHWPFVVFSFTLWPKNTNFALAAAILALIPTVISYRYFEQPIRKNERLVGYRAIRMATICVLVPLVFSFAAKSVADTHLGITQLETKPRAGVADDCGFTVQSNQWEKEKCTFKVKDSKGTIYLFGDSQARAFADGVIKSGNSLGYDVAVLATAGCPMATRAPLGVSWCEDIQSRLFELVEGCVYVESMNWGSSWCTDEKKSPAPSLVIVGNSATRYMGDEYRLPDDDGNLPREFRSRVASIVSATQEAVLRVQSQNVPVFLIHEAPSVLIDSAVSLIYSQARIEPRRLSEQVSRNEVVSSLNLALSGLQSFSALDPAEMLCREDLCSPKVNNEIIFFDSSHLNVAGSELFSNSLIEKIKKLLR